MSAPIRYDGRRFRPVAASPDGDADEATVFDYRQEGAVVWATYGGGRVAQGTLVATVDEAGALDVRYAHVGTDGALRTGTCRSVPELLPDGRLRLHETWRWTDDTSGDAPGGPTGESVVEEVADITE